MDKATLERIAFHLADVGGHLGHHAERWYSDDQKVRFIAKASQIVRALKRDGIEISALKTSKQT